MIKNPLLFCIVQELRARFEASVVARGLHEDIVLREVGHLDLIERGRGKVSV